MKTTSIAIIMASVLAYGCSRQSRSEVFSGQSWNDAKKILLINGYIDCLVKFELHKDFADKGGRIYLYKGLGGKEFKISTIQHNDVEVIENIQDGESNLEDRLDGYLIVKFVFPDK